MFEGLEFLFSGMFLGLVSGISPGPLLALVFSETLKHGRIEGMKVAVAPLITDLPIVLFVLLILSNLMHYDLVLGLISMLGACYLIYLGFENLRVKIEEFEIKLDRKDALKRGIIANFLNPSPYLFWLSIGGPIVFKSSEVHVSATILFVAGFYSMLVGSKIGIALIVEKSKTFVKSKHYFYVVRGLGVALIFFALLFVFEGLKMLGLF